jgi:hypothetical protein
VGEFYQVQVVDAKKKFLNKDGNTKANERGFIQKSPTIFQYTTILGVVFI